MGKILQLRNTLFTQGWNLTQTMSVACLTGHALLLLVLLIAFGNFLLLVNN